MSTARTSTVNQQVFVAEQPTQQQAIITMQSFMKQQGVDYDIQHRACGAAASDEDVGRTVALAESEYGAFIITSNDNEMMSTTSRKRTMFVKIFAAIYYPCPS